MTQLLNSETSGQKEKLSDGLAGWRWQLANAVRTLEGLESVLQLTKPEREGIQRSLDKGFPFSITPFYLSLCDPIDSNCPIRKQCVPHIDENREVSGDMRDPLGEETHQVVSNLIQRYPDRVLLLITDRCSVYCRFCTRSRLVGGGCGAASLSDLEEAFCYIERNPQIREVIISGGDPLTLPSDHLARIIDRLSIIPSVGNLRVATRVLATLPQRIGSQLCRVLKRHPSCWLMTHFNHPKELSDAARLAAQSLIDHGIPIMNHTVLLGGINDHAEVLDPLFRGLVRFRIRPYYLLQTDQVRGTSHFRTPIATGIDIMDRLQGRLSGIALPKFIVDTPGGKGKVPLGPEYLRNTRFTDHGRVTTFRTFRQELVEYVDVPDDDSRGVETEPTDVSATYPIALKPGDSIALIAPSSPFDIAAFERGVLRLSGRYQVIYDPWIMEHHGYLAGNDARRLAELTDALRNKNVKAIIAVRGGYGSTRLLSKIDRSIIAQNPKLLVGFSDVTALHALWALSSVRSIHGAMVTALGDVEEQIFERWISVVEGAIPPPITGLGMISGGSAVGPLIGGNLSILTALVGTDYCPLISGCVLFLEDVAEPAYRIDRMLTTLLDCGWIERVKAIGLGAFERSGSSSDGSTIHNTFVDRLGNLGIPVVSGIPSGHIKNNIELPLGAKVKVDADSGRLEFLESATKAV